MGCDVDLAVRARVRGEGIVQGVGFRPFVYSLATEYGLAGWVLNDGEGVLLEVEGPREQVQRFVDSLADSCPPDRFAAFRVQHPDHLARNDRGPASP